MNATKASMNYSYGFRMAIFKRITDSIHSAFPDKKIDIHLVWDCIHNSITEEYIDGKKIIVHRHTANRIFDGKPVIISGFNTTNSFLGVGLPNAEKTLFSSDHGAGVTIKKLEGAGLLGPHPKNLTTHIYQTRSPFKKVVHHLTDEGLDEVIGKLQAEGIMRPVAKLRPLAVFKG